MFSANQKPFVICTSVTSLHWRYIVCTRVTKELHSFFSQPESSNFSVYIIRYIKQSFGERKFSLGLDFCIIGGKKTLNKFLIKIITFRIVDMGFPYRKVNHIHFQ